jgi:hypothetical protein
MTTPIRERMTQEVAEGGSALLSWTLTDESTPPVPITLAQIGTAQWWHYDEASGSIVNGRTAVDIKNANGGTIASTSGACTLKVTPADNAMVDITKRSEWRIAFVRITYNGGAGVVEKEIAYKLINLLKI